MIKHQVFQNISWRALQTLQILYRSPASTHTHTPIQTQVASNVIKFSKQYKNKTSPSGRLDVLRRISRWMDGHTLLKRSDDAINKWHKWNPPKDRSHKKQEESSTSFRSNVSSKKNRHPCVETQSIAYTVFSRVHATLQPAMSVCLSVGQSATLSFFWCLRSVLGLLLLPNCLVVQIHHCPCSPACDWGSRVYGLVHLEMALFWVNTLLISFLQLRRKKCILAKWSFTLTESSL